MNAEKASNQEQAQFIIEHIVTMENKFCANIPMYRVQKKWEPNAKMDLDVTHNLLEKNHYEVFLTIDVSVEIDKDLVFELQVKLAGCFLIQGYTDKDIDHLLESFCPSILYPYARKSVADLVTDAGFPPLHLNPIDFETRYSKLREKQN